MKIPRWLWTSTKSSRTDVRDIVDEAKTYFVAQTVEPLKSVGRTLAFGLAGAICLGVGLVLLMFAMLRALQTETGTAFAGAWTFVPFLLTAVAGLVVAVASVFLGLRRYRKRAIIS